MKIVGYKQPKWTAAVATAQKASEKPKDGKKANGEKPKEEKPKDGKKTDGEKPKEEKPKDGAK